MKELYKIRFKISKCFQNNKVSNKNKHKSNNPLINLKISCKVQNHNRNNNNNSHTKFKSIQMMNIKIVDNSKILAIL